MFYKVEKIIDSTTIEVFPKWNIKGVEGDKVCIKYLAPIDELDEDEKDAYDKRIKLLEALLVGKLVELKGADLFNPMLPPKAFVFLNHIDISRLFIQK